MIATLRKILKWKKWFSLFLMGISRKCICLFSFSNSVVHWTTGSGLFNISTNFRDWTLFWNLAWLSLKYFLNVFGGTSIFVKFIEFEYGSDWRSRHIARKKILDQYNNGIWKLHYPEPTRLSIMVVISGCYLQRLEERSIAIALTLEIAPKTFKWYVNNSHTRFQNKVRSLKFMYIYKYILYTYINI